MNKAPALSRELHRSDEILVRDETGHGSAACVVTFDSFTDQRTLDRPGFADAFLHSRGIDAVHVLSRENDWYQYPEMPQVLDAIRAATQKYARVVAYGSSMGGYAAFRFAGRIGAQAFIALSPQFTIVPAVVPFERRWRDEARRIRFLWDELAPPDGCAGYVFYDPHDDDRRHFELLNRSGRFIGVRLPHAGHPAGGYLAELGLLQEAVEAIVDDRFDAAAFERAARLRRRESAKYWLTLALGTSPRRQRLRVALARQAAALAPDDPGYASLFADILLSAGRYEEAGEQHARALAMAADAPLIRHRHAWYLAGIGEFDEAEAIAEALIREAPGVGTFSGQLAQIRAARTAEAAREEQRRREIERLRAEREVAGPLARFGTALAAGIRRLRGRPAPGDELDDPATRTVTPAPPQFPPGAARHRMLRKQAPRSDADLVLIGDSLVEYWPVALFPDRRVLNLGIAADRTQHLLWRLRDYRLDHLAPRDVVILVGTNNLAMGDDAQAIAAGITAVHEQLGRVWPKARILVIETPPCGETFLFNARTRVLANRLLRRRLETLNVDEPMTAGYDPASPNYHPDHIHFSPAGYTLLSRLVSERLRQPPARGPDSPRA